MSLALLDDYPQLQAGASYILPQREYGKARIGKQML
jgi:hypothetical protein